MKCIVPEGGTPDELKRVLFHPVFSPIWIERLPCEEHSGDWHDKPLRWLVVGPFNERSKFSTLASARKYKSLRKRVRSAWQASIAYLNSV